MYLHAFARPGKNRQDGKLIVGKFCDLEGKNKEIHKGNMSCWREILPGLQGNKHFFQAWFLQATLFQFEKIITSGSITSKHSKSNFAHNIAIH